jgi:hypothetical protein
VAIGDVFTLQLRSTYSGQVIMNTLAFRWLQALDPTTAQALTLANDWKTHLQAFQATTLAYTTFVLQQVRGGSVSYTTKPCLRTGGIRLEGNMTGTLGGSKPGDALPPQSAIVTTLKTNNAGRSHRGRLYMTAISETDQAYGTVTPGIVTTMQTAWNTQLAKYGPAGTDPNWQVGIWSMRIATGCVPGTGADHALVPHDTPNPSQAFDGVTEFVVKATVYSQRRRTIGVGI